MPESKTGSEEGSEEKRNVSERWGAGQRQSRDANVSCVDKDSGRVASREDERGDVSEA